MMAIQHLNVGIALLLLLAIGCSNGELSPPKETPAATQSEVKDGVEMDQSVQLIMEAAGIEQDGAQGAAETLAELGVSELCKAELVSAKRGTVIRVVNSEDEVYYLGFGGLGYLEVVRKDSTDGEILYAPEE